MGPEESERLQARMEALHVGAVLLLMLLAVQFVLGMGVNLFGVFPNTSDVLRVLEASGDPTLTAHMAVAFLLLALGILVAVLAFRRPLPRRLSWAALSGALAIFWAFESGIEFVLSGFTNNIASFSMALGFLASVTIYGYLGLVSALHSGSRFVSSLVANASVPVEESGPARPSTEGNR